MLGAEDGAQTRDPQLGRLVLYQLSYFRICVRKGTDFSSITKFSGVFFFVCLSFRRTIAAGNVQTDIIQKFVDIEQEHGRMPSCQI